MNDALRNLYQEVILDHGKHPRHFHKIDPCSHCREGYNPLCGDQLTLYINIREGIIEDIGFTGHGCAISMASASLMSQAVNGKTVAQATEMFKAFHHLLTAKDKDSGHEEKLGKLMVLAGVKEFPSRVKCATLAWHTLENIMHNAGNPAGTP